MKFPHHKDRAWGSDEKEHSKLNEIESRGRERKHNEQVGQCKEKFDWSEALIKRRDGRSVWGRVFFLCFQSKLRISDFILSLREIVRVFWGEWYEKYSRLRKLVRLGGPTGTHLHACSYRDGSAGTLLSWRFLMKWGWDNVWLSTL